MCYTFGYMQLFVYTIADPDTTLPKDVMEQYRKSLEAEVATSSKQAWNRQRAKHEAAVKDGAKRAEDEEEQARQEFRTKSRRS